MHLLLDNIHCLRSKISCSVDFSLLVWHLQQENKFQNEEEWMLLYIITMQSADISMYLSVGRIHLMIVLGVQNYKRARKVQFEIYYTPAHCCLQVWQTSSNCVLVPRCGQINFLQYRTLTQKYLVMVEVKSKEK